MPKKRRLGDDPLGHIGQNEPDQDEDEAQDTGEGEEKTEPPQEEAQESEADDTSDGHKVRMTFYVPQELAERLRNAVYWHGPSTLSGLAEEGLSDQLKKLEEKNGGPFDQRPDELKGGRPVGS